MKRKKLEKKLVLLLPRCLKSRLDTVRDRGFTLNGFTRVALEKALDELKVPR